MRDSNGETGEAPGPARRAARNGGGLQMPKIGRRAFVGGSAAALFAKAIPASAQEFPARPITLIIPFPPGGSTTIVIRSVSDKLGEALGQQIVIDNRAGAGGTVGTRALAKSDPDGYTIGLGYTGTLAIGPNLYSNVGYDPRKDFSSIGRIATAPNTLVVHPSFPAKSVQELIAYAKANPGKVSYGSAGIGTVSHVCGEYFASATGIKLVHIPYKGTGPGAARRDRRSHPDGVRADPGHLFECQGRHHADAGGDQRRTLDACARDADHRRAGRAGVRRSAALRAGCACRHAAADHRQAQQGAQRRARHR